MELSRVAEELRAPLSKMPALDVMSAGRRRLAQFALSLMPRARVAGVRTRIMREVGAGVRLYLPENRRGNGALLWIHGGGYVIGRAAQDDRFCATTAAALGVPIVSVEYRLAPKHSFPAPLQDCMAAWDWLVESAWRLNIDPTRIAIGGQSAGGGLAAGLVQAVHDSGGHRPAAQWLFCPMLDDRTAARRELDEVEHFVWNNRSNAFGWSAFLGGEPGAAKQPAYAAPARRKDLSGLPPTWIGVGDIDLFAEEDRIFAERLQAAGVDVTFMAVPGAPHGFETWARTSSLAEGMVGEARRWLGERLGAC